MPGEGKHKLHRCCRAILADKGGTKVTMDEVMFELAEKDDDYHQATSQALVETNDACKAVQALEKNGHELKCGSES